MFRKYRTRHMLDESDDDIDDLVDFENLPEVCYFKI
jgi:hypothetical protein